MTINRKQFWEWVQTCPTFVSYEITDDEEDIVHIRFEFDEEYDCGESFQ